MGPVSSDKCIQKREAEAGLTHFKEEKVSEEGGVTWRDAATGNECQQPPEVGICKRQMLPRASEEARATQHLN